MQAHGLIGYGSGDTVSQAAPFPKRDTPVTQIHLAFLIQITEITLSHFLIPRSEYPLQDGKRPAVNDTDKQHKRRGTGQDGNALAGQLRFWGPNNAAPLGTEAGEKGLFLFILFLRLTGNINFFPFQNLSLLLLGTSGITAAILDKRRHNMSPAVFQGIHHRVPQGLIY